MAQNHIPVGLYGHQHQSEGLEALSDLSDDMDLDKVMLISAGTLFGSKKEMLPGVKRQYNVINVAVANGKAHLDVFFREDKKNDSAYPIWGEKHVPNEKKYIGFDVQLNHLSDDEIQRAINEAKEFEEEDRRQMERSTFKNDCYVMINDIQSKLHEKKKEIDPEKKKEIEASIKDLEKSIKKTKFEKISDSEFDELKSRKAHLEELTVYL